MPRQLSNQPKVSLYGVTRNTLSIGRACALNDRPVLGVYDPDPQRALRAALFLGVSARSSLETFQADAPEVIVSSLAGAEDLFKEQLLIQLGEGPQNTDLSNLCRAICEDSEEFPEAITNELAPLEVSLQGSEQAVALGREFFQGLPGRFVIAPNQV